MNLNQTIEFLEADIFKFRETLRNDPKECLAPGITNEGSLKSALNSVFQCFGGQEVHEGVICKAAALWFKLAKNHCFCDGNKRTAMHTMDCYLEVNGFEPIDTSDAYKKRKLDMSLNIVARKEFNIEKIAKWIEKNYKLKEDSLGRVGSIRVKEK